VTVVLCAASFFVYRFVAHQALHSFPTRRSSDLQVGTDMKGREAFQEIDYRAVFGTVAKWAVEIDDVSRLTEIVARAWTTALAGRPGPVVIALPEDMLSAETDLPPLRGPSPIFEPAPDSDAIASVGALLAGASKPLILIGGA